MPTAMGPSQLEAIMKALDVDALPPDEQEEVLLKVGELVLRDSLVRCLASLTEKERDEFGELTKSDASPDDVATFLVEHVPDADRYVGQAVDELTNDILAVTGA